MIEPQLCQSETQPTVDGLRLPCQNRGSRTLFGMHLCGTHDRIWRSRLAAGHKVRIHPARTLPLESPRPNAPARRHRGRPPTEPAQLEQLDQRWRYEFLHELICSQCARWVIDLPSPTALAPKLAKVPRCRVCGSPAMFSGEATRRIVLAPRASA